MIQKIENAIKIVNTLFGYTFLEPLAVRCKVKLEHRDVLKEINNLNLIETKLLGFTPTNQIIKDREDLKILIDNYTFLLTTYKEIKGMDMIPSRTKRYEMMSDLQQHVTNYYIQTNAMDVKQLAKETLKEVLNPIDAPQKLSKKEQIKLDAEAKTSLENLKLIRKHAKNNN
uniref:hypothetical protein n=1 Tax=Pedobacter schmidteae TaxID=2201271 RepID=UPI000EAFBA29|nr:hypothetical protein [Pedobacter schmidteae]